MIRPAAKAGLWRWREALIGVALVAVGLWWAVFTGGGILHYVGYAVLLAGLALIVAGIQRARFRQGGGGPGVVQITEGRIGYFGPLDGGLVDLREMTQLSLDPRDTPPHWVLEQPGQPALHIPLTATGADQLFDAFATLPGLRTEHMLRHMQAGGAHRVVIWQKQPEPRSALRLH